MAKPPPDAWMRDVPMPGNVEVLLHWIAPTVYAAGDYWRAIRCGLLGGPLPHKLILSILPAKYGGDLEGPEPVRDFEALALAIAIERNVDLATARRHCRDQGEEV